jgi:hypothetical protein
MSSKIVFAVSRAFARSMGDKDIVLPQIAYAESLGGLLNYASLLIFDY